jgi:hypothetical protein
MPIMPQLRSFLPCTTSRSARSSTSSAKQAEAAEIKAREHALKAELIARGVSEAEGMLFRATISEATRWTLDAERIRRDMGELWTVARSKVSPVVSVRVSARSTVARRAA